MLLIKRQNGMTAIGWLIVLALIGFFTLLALNILPIYYTGFRVYSALESLESDSEARGKSPVQLKKRLLRRLDIDSVYDVTGDDIYITREGNDYAVEVDYVVKKKFAGNLYIVVEFNKVVEIPAN